MMRRLTVAFLLAIGIALGLTVIVSYFVGYAFESMFFAVKGLSRLGPRKFKRNLPAPKPDEKS